MTSVEKVYPPSLVTKSVTFSGLLVLEGGLKQIIRVADKKPGFTRSPVCPHLQKVWEAAKVCAPVRLVPMTVTFVPPDDGPLPGSILVIVQGGTMGFARVPVKSAA